MKSRTRRTIVRVLGLGIAAFASFLAIVLLILAGFLVTTDYPEKLRRALEVELSQLSGAPASVRHIRLDLPRYSFELRGIELRAPGREDPVLELERVRGRLRLSELWNLRLQWTELLFEGLTVTLTQDPDKGLQLPSGSRTNPLGGITLAADHIAVDRAALVLSNEKVPWTLEAKNLSLDLRRRRGDHYEGKLAYDDGSLRINDHAEVRASVAADFEIVPRELYLRKGTFSSDLGEIRGTGKVGLAGGLRARFEIEAEGDAARSADAILGFRGAPEVLEGRSSFRGLLAIEPSGRTVEGTLVIPSGRIAGVPFSDWTGELFWDATILQIGYARGTLAGGRAKLQLHQPLPAAENPALLELDVEGASLSRILERAAPGTSPPPLDSVVSGRGSLRWPSERPWEIAGSFEIQGLEPDASAPPSPSAAAPFSFRAEGEVSSGELRVRGLQFATPFVSGSLSGTYPRTGSAEIVLDVDASDLEAADGLQQKLRRLLGAREDGVPSAWGVTGRGKARGRLTDRLPDLGFHGEITAEELTIDGIPVGSARADAVLSEGVVHFEDLLARSRDGSVSGRGSFSFLGPARTRDFDLHLALSSWPAAELARKLGTPYDVEGLLSGRVDARREADRLGGEIDLELGESRLLGLPFERGNARLVLDGSRMRAEPVRLVYRGSRLEGHLELDWRLRSLTGDIRADSFPIDGIGPGWAALGGVVDAEIAFSGFIDKPVAELTGRGQGIRLGGLDLGEAFLSGSVRESAMDLVLSMERQAAALVLEARVDLRGDYPAEGRIRWNGIDAAPWLGPRRESAPSVRVASNGSAEFRGALAAADPWKAMEVEARVQDVVFETDTYRIASIAPFALRLRDTRLVLERMSIEEAGSRLSVSGSLDLAHGALELEASGVASLGLLSSFFPGVATSGETTISAAITGTKERPLITGYADLEGGSVRIEGFRQALGGLEGRIVFDNRTIRIPGLRGVFGSGPVEIAGTVALEGLKPGTVDLSFKGSGIRLRYPEGLNATLEGELSLLGTSSERMVSGSLVLRDAVWSREYDLAAGILSDREGRTLFGDFAENELLRDLRLDIAVRAPSSLKVSNSLAVIAASAELELRGTLGQPTILGRSVADHGDIYFLGQRYQITSGTVDFVNPDRLEPFVDLTAETRVRSYRVELRLTGTPDRFHPELSSDPPLRTVDILRLLAGATERELLDNLVGTEAEELAGVGVASLLTERLSQEVGRRAERLFGIDRFSVNPFLVGQFANPTARVNVGKQISRELSVNYSTNLNAATEAIILIEYTPQGPMSWIVSRDEEGDVGIDVKFRKSF